MSIFDGNFFAQHKQGHGTVFIPGVKEVPHKTKKFRRDCDLISNIEIHTDTDDTVHYILSGGIKIFETSTDKFTQTNNVCIPLCNLAHHELETSAYIKSYIRYMIPTELRVKYLKSLTLIPFGKNAIMVTDGTCGSRTSEPIPCDISEGCCRLNT